MTGCAYGPIVGFGRRNGIVGILPSMSAAVTTARTPGMASAALVSMARMRPWPTGLRRKAACHWPSRFRSPIYSPRPRRKRKSSTRSTELPM
jgi:hypothetical protein